MHGGARGEEPPEWDVRSFKAARNVFQKVGARGGRTLYANSNRYSIQDGIRSLQLTLHFFSAEPSEIPRGKEGVAVELEFVKDGNTLREGFLTEPEVEKLTAMLRKKTLASLLISGELEKMLKASAAKSRRDAE